MTVMDEHGRPRPPLTGDETATLLGFLDLQRASVAWKSSGLDAAGLRASVGASSMTLGGMLKHLACVEDYWCSQWLHGNAPARWNAVGTEPDWDWRSAADDTPEQLRALWQDAVARSRTLVGEALADGGLDRPARLTERWDGTSWSLVPAEPGDELTSLRWILVHLIEEYARHVGHADLLRESVDGLTGE